MSRPAGSPGLNTAAPPESSADAGSCHRPVGQPAPRLRKLRSQYLLGSVSTLLLMLGLLSWNAVHQMDRALQLAADQMAQVIRPVLAAAVAPLLVTRDHGTLQQVLEAGSKSDKMASITVHDSSGKLIGHAGAPLSQASTSTWTWHETPLVPAGQKLGMLRFALDRQGIDDARRDLLRNTLLIALLVAAAGLGLLLLGTRALARGFARLAAASREVADGNHAVQLPDSRVLELHLVADSFNRMAAQVRTKITALRHSEQQLELRVQLRTAELRQALDDAEQANRAKSRFLSRMSHELRTPLNAVIGFAQLLRLDPQRLQGDQFEHAGQIQRAGWHLLDMINDVLDVSRIEGDEMQLKLQALSVAEVVAQVVTMLAETARERSIGLHDQTAQSGCWLLADRRRLLQVLSNLVGNAVKYTAPGGQVLISVAAAGDGCVALVVSDNGPGFSAAEQARLFEPFTRFERSGEAVPGTGIGLLLSRQLTSLMGGELRLSTAPAHGAEFTVLLPAAQALPDPALTEVARPATASAAAGAAGEALASATAPLRRLLYIEDNPTNACFIEAALEAHGGFSLQLSVDGETGLSAALASPPDLVLVDIGLPGIDGNEVCRRLRADARTQGLPLVAFSASAMPDDIALSLASGFDRYLCKPVDLAQLFDCLDDLTGSAEAATPP